MDTDGGGGHCGDVLGVGAGGERPRREKGNICNALNIKEFKLNLN